MTPAIVILGQGSLATARRIQQVYPGALIHGLARRVEGADQPYGEFGATLRQLYQQGKPRKLDFGIGYRWRPSESNVLLAVKKPAKAASQ